jgi:hypothetical protein
MKTCDKQGCTRRATHAPVLQIPAQGWAIDLHQPISMTIGVELCKDHAATFGDGFKWSDNPKIKEVVEILTRGKQPPDFDRAFHTVVRIDSEAYQKFLKMRGA